MAIELWCPKALIIDMSELKYTFGDRIEIVYGLAHPLKCAILIGKNCRRGLSTLDFGVNTSQDITENENVFDDIIDAYNYVVKS